MLFDIQRDPHEQNDIAAEQSRKVHQAVALLDDWLAEMMRTATHPQDPMWTVMREGGSFHTRRQLPGYIKRLRETGREKWADHLAARYAREA